MPLSREGSARTFRENVALAVLLASVAGAVNAAGFFEFGIHLSHMTGQAAVLGEALSSGITADAMAVVKILLAFVAGAATAASLLDLTSRLSRGRHTPALVLEAAVLSASAAWALTHPGLRHPALFWALSFAMGLQNALVTRISGAVIRTTHLTGVLTDLGIELAHVLKALLTLARSAHAGSAWRTAARFFIATERQRAWLHLALIGSFVLGATAGASLWFRLREAALAVPCLALFALIVVDLRAAKPPAPNG